MENVMQECSIKCICCKSPLVSLLPDLDQPMGGTEFSGGGDYGSKITDVAGLIFSVIICDDCLEKAILEKNVRENKIKYRSTLEAEFL